MLRKKREERLPGGKETRSQTSRVAVMQAEEGEAAFLAEGDIKERAQMPERGCASIVLEGRKLGWARNSR